MSGSTTWNKIWKELNEINKYQKKIDSLFIKILKSQTEKEALLNLYDLRNLIRNGLNHD